METSMLLVRILTSMQTVIRLQMAMVMIALTIASSLVGAITGIQLVSSLEQCAVLVVVAKPPATWLMMATTVVMMALPVILALEAMMALEKEAAS